MSEDKKAPGKKSEEDKKREKDQLINLWMNNLEDDKTEEAALEEDKA